MKKASPNVVHSHNLAILAAAVELGTCVVMETNGTEESAATLEDQYLTEKDIQETLAARLATVLGI